MKTYYRPSYFLIHQKVTHTIFDWVKMQHEPFTVLLENSCYSNFPLSVFDIYAFWVLL